MIFKFSDEEKVSVVLEIKFQDLLRLESAIVLKFLGFVDKGFSYFHKIVVLAFWFLWTFIDFVLKLLKSLNSLFIL